MVKNDIHKNFSNDQALQKDWCLYQVLTKGKDKCRPLCANQSFIDQKSGKPFYGKGLSVLWPNTNDPSFKDTLQMAEQSGQANNISPILRYACQGISFTWMGDLETDYLESITGKLEVQETTVLFAPHHGRERIPAPLLKKFNPEIIVIGESPSEHLEYYRDWNTITQNTVGDISFEVDSGSKFCFSLANPRTLGQFFSLEINL